MQPSRLRIARVVRIGFAACLAGTTAHADGLDVAAWVVRMPPGSSPLAVLAWVVALLVFDYVLNCLVVGWLATRWSGASMRSMSKDMVRFTLIGQISDRVGAVLALPVLMVVEPLIRKSGESGWVVALFAAQFVCAALAVGAATLWFARQYWNLTFRRAWALAILAATFTNPALGMLGVIALHSQTM